MRMWLGKAASQAWLSGPQAGARIERIVLTWLAQEARNASVLVFLSTGVVAFHATQGRITLFACRRTAGRLHGN